MIRFPSSGEYKIAFVCVQSGIQIRTPIDIQVIKFIPQPHGVMVLVEVDNYVSCYDRPRNVLLRSRKHHQVAVRKHDKVVMCSQ